MVKVMRCHQYSCLIEHGYDVSNMDSILCLNCLKFKNLDVIDLEKR